MKKASGFEQAKRWLVSGGALLSGGIAAASLVAWRMGRWEAITIGQTVPMAPSTGVLLLLLSGALVAHFWWPKGPVVRALGYTVVGFTALVSGLVCVWNLAGRDLPWEHWLNATDATVRGVPVGHMSPYTAGVFLLAVYSLLAQLPPLVDRSWPRRAGRAVALLGGLASVAFALTYASATPLFYDGKVVPMAFSTAAALAALNLALLAAGGSDTFWRQIEGTPAATTRPRKAMTPLLAVTAVAILGILLTGVMYLRSQQAELRQTIARELEAIADLKVAQVGAWRKERSDDARFLMRAPSVAKDVAAFFAQPNDVAARREALRWLELMQGGDRYVAIFLFDAEMNLRLALPDSAEISEAQLRRWLHSGPQFNDILFSDLHRGNLGDIHLEIAAPVFGSGGAPAPAVRPVGTIVLRMDPRKFLYPLVQSWPTPSATAESLLVRREGDEVVYLNELRHRAGAALALRRPLGDAQLPAARGLRGVAGTFEGIDYRGVPVLAATRIVPGTQWLLVAKVDRAEVYAPLRQEAWTVGAIVSALLLAAIASAAFFWRQSTAVFLQRELQVETERKALAERLALVMRHAHDIILLTDAEDGRIVEANDRALAVYGYTREEMLRLNQADLRPPEAREALTAQMRTVQAAGSGLIETINRRKDGSTFPVEISVQVVEIAGRRCRLGVARDITQRQAHEREIERLNRLYAALSQVNQAVVRASTAPALFETVCQVMVEYGGFPLAWIGLLRGEERQVVSVAAAGAGQEFLAGLRLSTTGETDGPTGRAVRDERGDVCNDLATDPRMEPWRAAMTQRGWRSLAAFPLRRQGRVEGTLTVYAAETGFFREKEIALLEETAGDISFALDWLEDTAQRQRAEAALQESERRLRFALEGSNDGLWDVELATGAVYLSPRGCEILGYRPDELSAVAKVWNELVCPEDLPETQARLADHLAGRAPIFAVEQRLKTKSGGWKWVLARGRVVERDAAGRPRRMTGTHTDITERKQAEAALRESERNYREVFNATAEAIFVHDAATGRVLDVNSAMLRMYGYADKTEALAVDFTAFHANEPPYTMAEAKQYMARSLQESSQVFEWRARRRNGEIFWAEVSLRSSEIGGQRRVLAVVRDIDERKRMEEQLRRSQSKFEALFRAVPDMLSIADRETGQIVEANDACSEAFGGREHVLGRNTTELGMWFSAEERTRYLEAIDFGGGQVRNYPAKVRFSNGTVRDFIISTQQLVLDGRSYLLTNGRDITELRQAERERSLLATALAASVNEIYLFDADTWRYHYVNEGALRNLGYTAEQMQYMTPLDLTPEFDRAAGARVLDPLERREKTGHLLETVHRRADGTTYPVEVRLQYFEHEGARVFLAVVQDITERKQAEAELRRRAAELTALNVLSREVSASLSLEDVAAAALREIREAVKTDLAFLFLRDGGRLVLTGLAPESARARLGEIPEHRVGECMCGLAVQHGRPLYSRDIFCDQRCTWEECKKAGFRSFAALPLRGGEEIIGVLGLASDTERDFERQASFLETLAGAVSVSLQNARLFAETKRSGERIREQLDELHRWQTVMIGREDRNMELKREVNELLYRLHEPARYPSQEKPPS